MSYTTTATNTYSGNNTVIVTTIANMLSGLPIVFTGNVFGNVTANATFYIGNITGSNQITLSSLPGGAVYALANGSGNMTATFSTGGQQIIDVVPPGDPLDVAFEKTNVNFDQIFAAGPVGSNIQIANNTIRTTNTNGNLILAPNGIGNVVSNVNIVPNTANLRNLGSPTQRWATIYTQYIDYTAGNISFSNFSVSGNISAGGYISAAGNVTGNYILGNGSLLTGVAVSTGNITFSNTTISTSIANSTITLRGNGTGNVNLGSSVSVTGNITANYYYGNGSQLTGLPFSIITNQTINGTGSANTFALAQSATSDSVFVTINGISQTPETDYTVLGNAITFTTTPIVGDVAQIRFLAGNILNVNYSNANVAAFLPTYTGNVSASYFIGNGSLLTGIAGGTGNTGNITFSNTTITSNIANANVTVQGNGTGNVNLGSSVSVSGNITANYYYGNGYYLTGLPFTTITNQTLTGNNVATNFVLTQDATANGIFVTINGISQTPDVDYTVAGNVLTFTTAPYTGDTMQVRFLASNIISGGGGNANTGNITFSNTTISSNLANANITLQATGTSNVVITNPANSTLIIESTGSNAQNAIDINTTGTTLGNNGGGIFKGTYILGNGTPTQLNNRFATFVGTGSEDGTTILFPSPVKITLDASANWTTGNTPTHISFWTTPFGTNVASESVRIDSAANLNVLLGNINIPSGFISTLSVSATGNIFASNVSASGNITANNFVGNIAAAPGNTSIQINVDGVLGAAPYFSYDYGANVLYAPSAAFSGNLTSGTTGLFVGLPSYTFLGSNITTQITSNANSYAQVNQQNISSGNLAQTDYVATADNGSDSTFYIDMGITSSTYANPYFFGDTNTFNDGYLFVAGNNQLGPGSSGVANLLIGSSNGNIKMWIGNAAQANVIQTISSTGVFVNGNVTADFFVGNLILPAVNDTQQQVQGTQQTILGDPFPTSAVGNVSVTVWTADSAAVSAAKMTMRAQYGNTGTPILNIEIMDIMMAKTYPNGIPVFTVSNRVKTNPAYADTLVDVTLAAGNVMQVTSSGPDAVGIVYWTYSVTAFNQT